MPRGRCRTPRACARSRRATARRRRPRQAPRRRAPRTPRTFGRRRSAARSSAALSSAGRARPDRTGSSSVETDAAARAVAARASWPRTAAPRHRPAEPIEYSSMGFMRRSASAISRRRASMTSPGSVSPVQPGPFDRSHLLLCGQRRRFGKRRCVTARRAADHERHQTCALQPPHRFAPSPFELHPHGRSHGVATARRCGKPLLT